MPHRIRNKQLEVLIDLPHENYAGARFDWSGKIAEVKFNGEFISGVELLASKAGDNYGRGFYNEFGIESPLGFSETKRGDWFHKIGVGLLQKKDDDYAFSKAYPIKPCNFDVKTSLNNVQFICNAPLVNGFSYKLKKEIELLENGFVIKYFLKNTGEKAIITDEYNHNFLAINDDKIGDDYQLKFPFELLPEQFEESVNPEEAVNFGHSEISFNNTPKEAFFFSNLSGGKAVEAKWELNNHHHKVGIRETGDFQTKKINLWGCGHVISPELFFEISLQTKQSINWTRRYELFQLKG
ncbi:MAG: hypothetical protein AB8H47_02975 [Bacteroidia bacterium]